MKNAFYITKYLTDMLNTNEELVNMLTDDELGVKIFPIDVKVTTTQPFIVIQRQSMFANYCKDGNYLDQITINIVCVSNNYAESVKIATLVRDTIDNKRVKDENISIRQIKLTSANEDIFYDSFVQQLTFEIEI